jgi:HicA toxin of bacterial toxin-antitoxin,
MGTNDGSRQAQDRLSGVRGAVSVAEFEQLLNALGYEQIKAGKTGGSRRKYRNKTTGHLIFLHEPHGGQMERGMVKRLQEELESRGLLQD